MVSTVSSVHAVGGTTNPIVAQIVSVAAQLGLDPRLAVADAIQESGLNPQAVGDQGTSFGLYQLHRGGELGNLTPAQAFDPVTNAMVALTTMANVAHAHPNWSPGQIAAAAERPADQQAYAASVNQIYQSLPTDLSTFQLGAGGSVPASTNAAQAATLTSSSSSPGQFVSGIGHMAELVVGVLLVVVGGVLIVKDLTGTDVPGAAGALGRAAWRRIPDAGDRQARGASSKAAANRKYAAKARKGVSRPGPADKREPGSEAVTVKDDQGMDF